MTRHIVTRVLAATAATAIASLALALPASAMRPPEPGPDSGGVPSVVLAPSASADDGGLQLIQVGAGLLAGAGIGAAASTAMRSRRQAHLPRTA
jgi:hypothetical protein